MHRITTIVAFAVVTLLQVASLAQDGPILNPSELIGLEPEPTEFACIEQRNLPTPIGLINWRDFPPEGLVEIQPQTRAEAGWVSGFPLANGLVAGPQTYSYDENGRLATWISIMGDFENPADIQIRTSYAYNDAGLLAEVLDEVWSEGRWENGSRSSYSYLETGLVSDLVFSLWVGSDWYVRRTVSCQYDDNDRLTKRYGELCPLVTNGDPGTICAPNDSTDFFYDDLGRIEAADRFARAPTQAWVRVRTRFEYDETGKLVEAVNPRNIPFSDTDRFTYLYDTVGRLSEQEIFRNFTKRRIRYAYQFDGLLTRTADDVWVLGPDGYLEEGETRYEYDGLLTLQTATRYLPGSEPWSQSQYRYDNRNRIAGEIRSVWTGAGWDPEVDATYEYDDSGLLVSYTELWDSDQRGGEFRMVYSYAVGTAISGDVPASRSIELLQNYPNPVKTRTTIEYTLNRTADVRLTVFDVLGRIVKPVDAGSRAPGSHSVELDVSDLSPGVYLYQVEANGTSKTGNLVVTQ